MRKSDNQKLKSIAIVLAVLVSIIAVTVAFAKYVFNQKDQTVLNFFEYRIQPQEITLSTENYTGEEVTVTITPAILEQANEGKQDADKVTIQYKLGDDANAPWVDYTGPFNMSENQTIHARLVSDTDNFTGPVTDKNVTNIAVAKIGSTTYKTLAEAITAWTHLTDGEKQNAKIEMLADTSENVTIPQGENVKLDLCGFNVNGKTAATPVITVNGGLNIIDSGKTEQGSTTYGSVTSTNSTAVSVASTGTLTLGTNEVAQGGNEEVVDTNGPVINGGTSSNGVVVEEGGNLNFYDGKITAPSAATHTAINVNNTPVGEENINLLTTPNGYRLDISVDTVNGKEVATLVKTLTVHFDSNGGTPSDIADIEAVAGKAYGTYTTWPENPAKEGYLFEGWKYQENTIIASTVVAANDSHTLTAEWTPITYTITYNANTGTGTIPNTTATYDTDVTLPNATAGITKTGYTLKGWSADSNATVPTYTLGQTVTNLTTTNNDTITLYAIWKDETAPNDEAPTGTSTTNTITVNCNQTDNGSGIDTNTIQYSIYKDGAWTDWQNSPTFEGLTTNTDYQVKTRVIDNDGNGYTESQTATIKTQQIKNATTTIHKDTATGDVITPTTGMINNSTVVLTVEPELTGTTTITVTKPDGTSTTYTLGTDIQLDQDGTYHITIPNTVTGEYTVTTSTTDGTNTSTNTQTFQIDRTSPVIAETVQTTTNSITVNANATDAHSGVDTVTYTLKDENNITVATNTTGVFEGLTDNKNYTVEIKVTDNAGNTSTKTVNTPTQELVAGSLTFKETSEASNFTPRTTAPSSDSEKVWKNEDIDITIINGGVDNNGTIVVPTGVTTTYTVKTIPTQGEQSTSSAISQSPKTLETTNADYEVTVTTTDGTNTKTTTYYFSIDKIAPTVAISPMSNNIDIPQTSNTANVETTLTITEDRSGIATARYAISTDNQTAPTEGWTTATPASTIAVSSTKGAGTYYIWTEVTDNSGNVSTTVKTSGAFIVQYVVEFDRNIDKTQLEIIDESTIKTTGNSVTLATAPTREGYLFKGWALDEDAQTATHSAGTNYTVTESTRFYAVWSEVVASTKIGNNDPVLFDSVQAAIDYAAANEGAVVTLIKNEISEDVTVAAGQNLTINLNNKTWNNSSNNIVTNYGTLTITDTTSTENETAGQMVSTTGVVNNAGTLTVAGKAKLNGTDTTINNNGELNISGGLVTGSNKAIYNNTGASKVINISGGKVEANSNYTIHNDGNGTVNITGGTVDQTGAWSTIYSEGGNVNITSGNITSSNAASTTINIDGGTATITGGTISSTNADAIIIGTNGTVTLGDNTDATVAGNTTPVITGNTYGVTNNGTFNFYDGIIKAPEGQTITGTVTDTPTGYRVINGTEGTLETAYLDNHYTVTYNYNNATSGDEETSKTVAYGENYGTLPAPTKTGYTFDGWKLSNNTITSSTTVTTANDHTLTAEWTANQYTLTFNANGGTVDPTSKTVTYDSTYGELPTPTRNGYTFEVWQDEQGNIYTSADTVDITENKTLIAQWTANNYTVTFNPNGGTVDPASKSVTFDQAYGTLPTPTKTGYEFNGWKLNNNTITAESTVATAQNHTLTADWTATTYTITYDNLNGGSYVTGTPQPTSYTIADTVTLPTLEKTGYTFLGWKEVGAADNTAITEIAAGTTGNKILEAVFAPGTSGYTLTYYVEKANQTGYDIHSTEFISATTNDVITLSTQVITIANTTFEKATDAADNEVATVTVAADGSTAINVYYTRNTYQLTVTAGTNTVNATGSGTYKWGQEVEISAEYGTKTDFNYANFRWTTDDTSILVSTTATSTKVTMPAANTTVTALADKFPTKYNITYELKDGTAGEQSPSVANYNQNVTISQPTKEGWTFTGWTSSVEDGLGANANNYTENWDGSLCTSTIYRNLATMPNGTEDEFYTVKLTANWRANSYRIIYDLDGGTEGQYSPSIVQYNQYFNLSNPTKDGCTFKGWTSSVADGLGASADNSTGIWDGSLSMSTRFKNLAVMADGTETELRTVKLTAVWGYNYYKITYDLNGGTEGSVHPSTANYNQYFNLSNPTKEGFTFNGWTSSVEDGLGPNADNSAGAWQGTLSTSTRFKNLAVMSVGGETEPYSVKLTANWKYAYYNIVYDLNGGTAGSAQPSTGNYNKDVTISNATKSGYTFLGWTSSVEDGLGPQAGLSSTSWDGSASRSTIFRNLAVLPDGTESVPYSVTLTALYGKLDVSSNTVTIDLSDTENLSKALTVSGENYGTLSVSSSNSNIATASIDGTTLTITGLQNGTATITLQGDAAGGTILRKSVNVTVITTPTAIAITPSPVTIGTKSGYNRTTLNATITPSTANSQNRVTWSSSNTSIATVDTDGNVTGRSEGTTLITATTQNGVTSTATVIVDGTAPTVEVTIPGGNTYANEHTAQIQVTDSGIGLPQTQTISYGWSTSNSSATGITWETTTLSSETGIAEVTTPAGVTGTYYLWVQSGVKDAFDNATTANYINTLAVANLDNVAPVIAFDSSSTSSPSVASENSEITIPLKITEEHSGVYTSAENSTKALTGDDISVYVDGNLVSLTSAQKIISGGTKTGNDYKYTLTLTGVTGSGDLSIVVGSGTVEDKAGNTNAETTIATGVTMDSSSFTLSISAKDKATSEAVSTLTNADTLVYTFKFNKPTTDFDVNDISIVGGTIDTTTFTAVSSTEYTVEVNNTVTAVQTVSVPANSCQDSAGNKITATNYTINIDKTAPEAPVVTVNTGSKEETAQSEETKTIYTGSVTNDLTFSAQDNTAAVTSSVVGYKVSTTNDDWNSQSVVNSAQGTATTAGNTYYVRTVDSAGNLSSQATVVTLYLVTLDVTPETVSVENQQTTTLTATGNNTGTITWSSSDDTIATVAQDGTVTAHQVGTVTITATAANDTSVQDTATVTVTKGKVTPPTAKEGLVYNGSLQTGVEAVANAKYTLTGNTATNAGTYTATVSLVDPTNYKWSDNTTVDKQITWNIDNKTLTPSVTGTITKVYDGTTAVTAGQASISLSGAVTGESPTATATYAYDNANVGTGKTVTASNITLTGSWGDNYELSTTTATTTGIIREANYVEVASGGATVAYYETLQEALAGVTSGYTIKPLSDRPSEAAATLASGKTAILDLNGKTITMTGNLTNAGTLTINGSGKVNNTAIMDLIKNSGTLTLAGSVEVSNDSTSTSNKTVYNTGTVIVDGATVNSEEFIAIYNDGTSGKVDVKSGTVIAKNKAIQNSKGTANTTSSPAVKISGGTVESTGYNAIWNDASGMVYITGGTVTSNSRTIWNNGTGKIKIEDGNIISTGTIVGTVDGVNHYNPDTVVNNAAGSIEVSGGTITCEKSSSGIAMVGTGPLTVTGGTITGISNGIWVTSSNTPIITIGNNSDGVSITSPKITGTTNGITTGTGIINFYDGIITGATDKAIVGSGTVNNATNCVTVKTNADGKQTAVNGPGKPTITAKLNNASGAAYTSGTWTNQNVYVSVSDSKVGAGIREYQWLENGTWTTRDFPTSNNVATITYTANSERTIKFRVIDNNGVISEESDEIIIRKETTKPTVMINTESMYVTDGVVTRLDGINNANGSHISSGTTWSDISGNNKNGTITGGTWGANYLDLSGSNSWVNLGVMNSNYQTLDVTFSADTTDAKNIIGNWENGGGGLMIRNGNIYGEYYVGSSYTTLDSGIKVVTGKVYNASITYDGSTVILYVNGVKTASKAVSGNIKAPGTTIMAIGTNPNGTAATSPYFDGKIYTAAVYNKALTAAQVLQNAQAGMAAAGGPTNAGTITYTMRFSEAVTGFDTNDITITNGTKGAFSTVTAGSLYRVAATTTDGQNNTQTIALAANGAVDKAGNGIDATSKTVVVDRYGPATVSGEIKNLTATGYDVYVYNVSDVSGINRVTFPTWTSANGQDDLIAGWNTYPGATSVGTLQSDGTTWVYHVNTTDHKNEAGTYITHVYAWDNLGNRRAIWTKSDIIVPTVTLTYDYQDSYTYSGANALDTGYKYNWDKNFKVEAKFKVTTLGKRYAVFSAWNDTTKNLALEITTDNKLRIYMGDAAVDETSTATIPANTDITAVYEWNASTKTYTLTATGTNVNISMTNTVSSMTGTGTRNVLVGRDERTNVFNPINISMFKISTEYGYNTAISTLPTVTKPGYTYSGWYDAASGGNKVTSVTMPASNKTIYARKTPNNYTITYDYNYLNNDIYGNKTINASSYQYAGTSKWTATAVDNTSAKMGKEIQFTATTAGTGGPHLQPPTVLTEGNTYTWSVYLKSSVAKTINIGSEQGGTKSVNVTTSWQRFTYTFTAANNANNYHSFYFYISGSNWAVGDKLYIHSFEESEVASLNTTTQTKTYGNTLGTLPTASRTGYIFDGWYTAPVGGTKIETTTSVPAANTTYYAHWTVNNYTITYNYNGTKNYISPTANTVTATGFEGTSNKCFTLGTVYTDGLQVGDQLKVTFKASYSGLTAASGQTAAAWFQGSGNSTAWSPGFPGQSSGTRTVNWTGTASNVTYEYVTTALTANQLSNSSFSVALRTDWYSAGTITITDIKVTRVTTETVSLPYGSPLGTLPTPVERGYNRNGWYTAASGGTAISSSTTVTGNATYYAQWTPIDYKLILNPNSGSYNGSTSNTTLTNEYNTEINLGYPTRTGYTFVQWKTSDGSLVDKNILTYATAPAFSSPSTNAAGGWRTASTSATDGGARTVINVTDAPIPGITKGFQLVGNGTATDVAQDGVPVTSGQQYTISVWAKGTGTLYLQAGQASFAGKGYTMNNVTGWTKYSWTFTAGTDGSVANGMTNIYFGNRGASGTIQICGMKVEAGNGFSSDYWNKNQTNVTLVAEWATKTINVTFMRNTSSTDTTKADQTFTYGVTGQKFSEKGWTREGYILSGWALSSTATSTNYGVTSGVSDGWINSNAPAITLYAVWTQANYGEYNGTTWIKGYITLAEALSGVTSGRTIKVLNSRTETTSAELAANKTITFDTNGKTVTVNGSTPHSFTYNGSATELNSSIINKGNMTITGTGTIATSLIHDTANALIFNEGTLNIVSGSIIVAEHTSTGEIAVFSNYQYNGTDATLFTIGQNDGTVSTTRPVIIGHVWSYITNNNATQVGYIKYFDGVVYNSDNNMYVCTLYQGMLPENYKVYYVSDDTYGYKYTLKRYYTISYDVNGGTGNIGSQDKFDSVNIQLTSSKPTRTGYTFAGWNTKADGTGTNYASGATYSGNANATLYAKWTPNKYKATLDNQDATTAGTTACWWHYNTTTTISGTAYYYCTNEAMTTGMANSTITKPTKTGYTFGGYWTGKNGTGTQYVDATGKCINNLYKVAENKTLYAKWTANKVNVSFNANVFSTTNGTRSGLTFTYEPETSILTINGTWNSTSASLVKLSGLTMQSGDKYNIKLDYQSGSYTTTVTPVFVLDLQKNGANTSTRTYRNVGLPTANSATGSLEVGSGVADANGLNFWMWQSTQNATTFNNYKVKINVTKEYPIQQITYNTKYSGFPGIPKRTGYSFSGWYTAETGGTVVTTSTIMNSTSDHTLYARWTPYKVTLQMHVNGGSLSSTHGSTISTDGDFITVNGSKAIHTINYGQSLGSDGLANYNNGGYINIVRSGYIANTAAIYNTKTDGTGTSFDQTSAYAASDFANIDTENKTVTLYVNWVQANYLNTTTNKYYAKLNDAFAEAVTGQTIKVMQNVTETSNATLSGNKTLTLNTNGKTITVSGANVIGVSAGNLTVNGSGTINSESGSTLKASGSSNITVGSITLNSTYSNCLENIGTGTVTVNTGSSLSANNAAVWNHGGGTANITAGTITSRATVAVSNTENGTTNISNATITSNSANAVENYLGTVTMNSGTINANATDGHGFLNYDKLIIKAGTINGKLNAVYNEGKVTISGGTFKSTGGYAIHNCSTLKTKANPSITISGGSIESTVNHGIYNQEDGYVLINNVTLIKGTTGIYNYASGVIEIVSGTIQGTQVGIYSSLGNVIIGANDSTVSTTSPSITGTTIGASIVYDYFKFYDGVIKGATGIYNQPSAKPAGYEVNTATSGSNQVVTLKPVFVTSNALTVLDAKNNNGATSHSNSATTWKALTGANGAVTAGTWGANYLSLNGTTTWVNLGRMNTAKTLQVTFSVDSLPSAQQYIIGNLESGGGGIYINTSGTVGGGFHINGDYRLITSNQKITAGQVYDVAVVYDGTKEILYINGVAEKTYDNLSGYTIKAPANSTVMSVGSNPAGSGIGAGIFKGKVYSASVYSTGLTAAQVLQNARAGFYVAGATIPAAKSANAASLNTMSTMSKMNISLNNLQTLNDLTQNDINDNVVENEDENVEELNNEVDENVVDENVDVENNEIDEESINEATEVNEADIQAENNKNPVVQIENEKYTSIQEAIDAAEDGATIKLIEDIELHEEVIIEKDKNIILDLNNKTLTSTSENTINNKGTLTISGEGIIKNEIIEVRKIENLENTEEDEASTVTSVIYNTGTLTIEKAIIRVEKKNGIGILNKEKGVVTLGNQENEYDSTEPIIYATSKGATAIVNSREGEINFYDGRIITTSSIKNMITRVLSNYKINEELSSELINTTLQLINVERFENSNNKSDNIIEENSSMQEDDDENLITKNTNTESDEQVVDNQESNEQQSDEINTEVE